MVTDALIVVIGLAALMGGGIIVIDSLIIRGLRRQQSPVSKGGPHGDQAKAANDDGQP